MEYVVIIEDDGHRRKEAQTDFGFTTKPYVSTTEDFVLLDNLTANLTIEGGNFDDECEVYLGDEVTVNSITATPNQLIVNYTTGATLQTSTPLVVSRYGKAHFGENPTVTVTDVLTGTGSAGTFTTNFDAGGTGQALWGSNWTLEIFGTIDSLDGFFNSGTSTPSSNTGANASSPQGGDFAFAETSNPNNGAGQYATMTTTNFREIQQIDLYAYMYGADIGALVIETQNADDSWTERYRQNGQIQTAYGQAWTTISIDATTWEAKALRITFEETTGYRADICLDNIVITSV